METDSDRDFESDVGTAGAPAVDATALDIDAAKETDAGTPEVWVSGASVFDDASEDGEEKTTTRAF